MPDAAARKGVKVVKEGEEQGYGTYSIGRLAKKNPIAPWVRKKTKQESRL